MGGQVSGLGTVHPLLTLSFFSTWILPLHVVSFCVFDVEEEVVVIRNGWTPKKIRQQNRHCQGMSGRMVKVCGGWSVPCLTACYAFGV